MSDNKTASWIAALEQARAELELALSADEHWLALSDAAGDTARHERALADNPVYRCWEQLNEAMEALRRRAQAEPTAARRRVSLWDVLEHIRSDPSFLQDTKPQAAAVEAGGSPPSWTAPSAGPATPPVSLDHAPPEAEEAMVSFVICEPARSAPAADGGGSSAAREPTPPEPPESEAGHGAETEVVIVQRPR